MSDPLTRLLTLCDEATPGPWVEDDGFVHSGPATEAVTKYIDRLMSDPAYDAEQGGDQKDRPETVVALCDQNLPNFDADARFIATFDPVVVREMVGLLKKQRKRIGDLHFNSRSTHDIHWARDLDELAKRIGGDSDKSKARTR